jgi:hypothetical protein
MTKEQLPFVKKNRSVSTTNEHQNQWNIKHHKVCNFSFQVLPQCGGTVWHKGGSLLKMAERHDSKTNRWSLIAPMKVKRRCASATALNGNMNIMKWEGIRTKCVAKWIHNMEVISVRQHANVLGVIAVRSCKNALLSFAMFVCLIASDNSKTVKHIFMKLHIAKSC